MAFWAGTERMHASRLLSIIHTVLVPKSERTKGLRLLPEIVRAEGRKEEKKVVLACSTYGICITLRIVKRETWNTRKKIFLTFAVAANECKFERRENWLAFQKTLIDNVLFCKFRESALFLPPAQSVGFQKKSFVLQERPKMRSTDPNMPFYLPFFVAFASTFSRGTRLKQARREKALSFNWYSPGPGGWAGDLACQPFGPPQ